MLFVPRKAFILRYKRIRIMFKTLLFAMAMLTICFPASGDIIL